MGLMDSNGGLKYFARRSSPRTENAGLTRVVTSDVVTIPREIWMTFGFTLVVGAFLCGGGMYLVYIGTMKNVTDFVVLGSCGSVVGFCFSSVGSVILVKSMHDRHAHRDRKRRVTLVHCDRNSLLKANSTTAKAKPVKPQKAVQTANRKSVKAGKPEASKSKTTAKNINDGMSTSGNVYDYFPTIIACDNTTNHQGDALLNKGSRREKVSPASKVGEKTDSIFSQRSQKGEVNQELAYASHSILQKQKTIAWVSLDSIASDLSTDSCKTFQETMTIVAEVHAQLGSSRSSLEYSNPVHHDWHYLQQSFLPISRSTSDDEDGAGIEQDMFVGDGGSRSDTGVGESVSEEDSPFINDDMFFSYRVNILDNEISNDALMRIVINDPLIYSQRNDVENNYMLNTCQAITEVLVHSG